MLPHLSYTREVHSSLKLLLHLAQSLIFFPIKTAKAETYFVCTCMYVNAFIQNQYSEVQDIQLRIRPRFPAIVCVPISLNYNRQ